MIHILSELIQYILKFILKQYIEVLIFSLIPKRINFTSFYKPLSHIALRIRVLKMGVTEEKITSFKLLV